MDVRCAGCFATLTTDPPTDHLVCDDCGLDQYVTTDGRTGRWPGQWQPGGYGSSRPPG